MKWIKELFNHSLKTYISGVLILATLTGIGIFREWFLSSITIRVFCLAIIGLAPIVLYFFARWIISHWKRTYKTHDLVNVIADDQKFVVIRYHNWYPYYVVCKGLNRSDLICVHQKYLTRYVELGPNLAKDLFPKPNTDYRVKTATISRL